MALYIFDMFESGRTVNPTQVFRIVLNPVRVSGHETFENSRVKASECHRLASFLCLLICPVRDVLGTGDEIGD